MNDIRCKRLFNIYGFTGGSFAGNVYDTEGVCPALNVMGGGNRQPIILEYEKVEEHSGQQTG